MPDTGCKREAFLEHAAVLRRERGFELAQVLEVLGQERVQRALVARPRAEDPCEGLRVQLAMLRDRDDLREVQQIAEGERAGDRGDLRVAGNVLHPRALSEEVVETKRVRESFGGEAAPRARRHLVRKDLAAGPPPKVEGEPGERRRVADRLRSLDGDLRGGPPAQRRPGLWARLLVHHSFLTPAP